MVVLSQPIVQDFTLIKTCKTPTTTSHFNGIPIIDLTDPEVKSKIIDACDEFGFFKVINHGVSLELVTRIESLAMEFFQFPQPEKDRAGPPTPFGYGNKKIGPNGDVGWIEFLLFNTSPEFISQKSLSIFPENPEILSSALNEYIGAVKEMVCGLLELVADGLKISPRNVWSKLLKDEKSDSFFRVNHYPPCPELQALSGRNLIGFGEHTDPQIMSAVTSNNTSGLQIALKDGTWVPVPADQNSFFLNVGDSLQVMTNGRFRSVKHRVIADGFKSRISMVYFGGPPLDEKIKPLSSLMEDGEECLYQEFTWCEYKKSAYKSRLGDNRLEQFAINNKNLG